jgi:hypothetical protein
MPSAEKAWEEL